MTLPERRGYSLGGATDAIRFSFMSAFLMLFMYNMTMVMANCVSPKAKKRKYNDQIKFSSAVSITKNLLAGGVCPPAVKILLMRHISLFAQTEITPRKKSTQKNTCRFHV